MNLTTKHPDYATYAPDWLVIRDTYAGERRVKDKTTTYLPATAGMTADGLGTSQPGAAAYAAYLSRAIFPDLVKQAATAMVGLMHRRPPVIQLPKELEGMRTNATLNGESLEVLLRRINEQQLLTGRLGLMVDIPNGAGPAALPYLVAYYAESITNWDSTQDGEGRFQLAMACLDESGSKRNADLQWQTETKYRIMLSGAIAREMGAGNGEYVTGTATADLAIDQMTMPMLGGRTLDQIPFVLLGSKDLAHAPDVPPLLSVARLALACYRGEADYRQALFQQGQDTLVLVGASDAGGETVRRVGAGSVIELPMGGDAKMVGVEGKGLSEMRTALENDYKRAAENGAQLLESRGKSAESGDALRVRVAARTATLANIAMTGAEGLQQALRLAARWRGLDESQVVVTPNLDFTEAEFNIQDLVYFMDARERGVPLSLESIHRYMKKHDLTEMDFAAEVAQAIREKSDAEKLLGPTPKGQAKPGGGPGGGGANKPK